MHTAIQVLLADDHPFVRAGIRATLADEQGVAIVGEASDGHETQQLCGDLRPDVLLLDLSMPGPPPLETVATLRDRCPDLKILVLTAHDDDAYVRSMRSAGVAGYLFKDEMPRTIVRAIYGVMRGEPWFTQREITQPQRGGPELIQHDTLLTSREMGVLRQVVMGKTNAEIGTTLNISEKTVEKHLGEVFTKLGVTTRVEAAVWAVRIGLA